MRSQADSPTAPPGPADLQSRIAAWTAHATRLLQAGQGPDDGSAAREDATAHQRIAAPVAVAADPGPAADDRGFDRAKSGNTGILVTRLAADGTLQPSEGDPDAPFGWFHGWRIIGGETRIDGGVYLGRKPREAIVVDMRRPGSLLRKVYDLWLERLLADKTVEQAREDLRAHVLSRVAQLVEDHMPYDEQVVKRLDKQGFLRPDEPIDLDVFLAAKGGVCRHQVCFVGAVLERLIDGGWLRGKVSLERKFVSGWFSHAWVRLDAVDGAVFILDPAQRRYALLAALDPGSRMLYGRNGGA
ncbi:MAG: hypothetical protein FJ100_08365 [Deltaproteobacteria bacterium]|nr:hypothetical protein [Deltaproteobacteria bacterium]